MTSTLPAGAAGFPAAEDLLESPFRPRREDLLSFLVNGLCLIGRHRVLAWEGLDGAVAEALEAQGHRVEAAGPGYPTAPAVPAPAGAYDRALRTVRAIGHGGDGADRLWLAAMHRALRPGGLLLFHALDRDRAWSLVAGLSDPGAGAGLAFDPRAGWVTARVRPLEDSPSGRPAARAAVKAYNLGEIQRLLAETGFVLERAYGDWDGGSPEEAGARTGRILVVASKARRRPSKGLRRPTAGSVPRGRRKNGGPG